MSEKLEVIYYPSVDNMKIFVVDIEYRLPHTHPEMEILFVFKGNPIFIINDEKFEFHQGDIILINSNDKHEIISNNGISTFLVLNISTKYFEGYFSQINQITFKGHCIYNPQNKLVIYTFLNLARIYIEKANFYKVRCASMINIMFVHLLDAYSKNDIYNDKSKDNGLNKIRLGRITNYVEENYYDKISLKEIAEMEGVSVYFLSRFIHKHLELSFQDYLTFVRFNHARELILTTNMKLVDICYQCGFSDYRYMTQAFKKYCDCTPKEFKVKAITSVTPKLFLGTNSQRIYNNDDVLNIIEDTIKHYNLIEPH
ncbi:MAG: AraC family transcriptional regulator [Clostridium celatum]|nr:AraC family transcriptional regulator [Clostridium celatum]MDU4979335.1 AraC family transcriptional regulator [Clostridium celatum]